MRVGFLVFPGVTQLDFTGPLQVVSAAPGIETAVIAKDRQPIRSDGGLTIVADHAFNDAPPLDVLCVPGGLGVPDAIRDPALMAYVKRAGAEATWLTSVCTGVFILGTAGFTDGRRATTHWAFHHLLPLIGAVPEKSRVVTDGNLISGGGVTAGIDFGLSLIGALVGETAARAVQLGVEYDPAPPFNSGSPDRAPPPLTAAVTARFQGDVQSLADSLAASAAHP
ncbi:DJ-1/PfpI family protein [Brevundimonas sp.]|uniref:DJ-1/PfpI family protein n=1 Tax=Brevundimonas sp. TaxID=1871086 RepID=UPI0022BC23B2|nr:DJ-1/PfpI family protein [Brevundimonas sp.]MCZ8193272.1 DJ-1/PfpI family protein [Brevundimonas sp.]